MMWYLSPPWWRLAAAYAAGGSSGLALQRGSLAVVIDALQLGLLGCALGRRRRRRRGGWTLASAVTRACAGAAAAAAVYACAQQRALSDAADASPFTDTAWPLQHAALTTALALALAFSGALRGGVLPGTAVALLALCAVAWVHAAAVRLAAPACDGTRDVAAADLVAGVAWLGLAAAHALGGGSSGWCGRKSDGDGDDVGDDDDTVPAAGGYGVLADVAADSGPAPVGSGAGRTPYHLTDTAPTAAVPAHDTAPWWSRLSFGYLDGLIAAGVSRQLGMGDIDPMPATCTSDEWAARLDGALRAWRADGTGGGSLLRELWSQYGAAWAALGALQAASVALSFAGPLTLNALLSYLESDTATGSSAWTATPLAGLACAAAMAAQSAATALVGTQQTYRTVIIQSRMRAGLTAAIFRAMLATPTAARAGVSSGALLNYISVDAQRLCDAVSSAHQLWSLPVQVAVTLWLLWTQVGPGAGAGLVVLALLIPLNLAISKRIGRLTGVMMTHRDDRVLVSGEMLGGIKTIKMSAWEVPLLRRVAAARSLEFAALTARKYLDAACVYLWASTPVLMSLATFGTVVLAGGGGGSSSTSLSASTVFTTVSLLQMLVFPLNAFPWIITGMLEAAVSLLRLEGFLRSPLDPALDAACADGSDAGSGNSAGAAAAAPDEAVRASGSYRFPPVAADESKADAAAVDEVSVAVTTNGGDGEPFTLHLCLPDGSPLVVRRGECVAVIGPVGAGKSALLRALLGEMLPAPSEDASGGRSNALGVAVPTSYAPQSAWIRGVSLRDNIVMGEPWDAARYAAVLEACALGADVATLAAGDATIVSESTLSGGQQQRISMARALYSASELVLLDDPISALDVRVGAWVWTHALGGGGDSLLSRQRRARLIVTHDTRFLASVDRVVVVAGGRITFAGPPGSLPADVAAAAAAALHSAPAAATDDATNANATSSNGSKTSSGEVGGAVPAGDAPPSKGVVADKGGSRSGDDDADATAAHAEGRQRGVIQRRVLWTYLLACGLALSGVVAASLVGMQLTRNGSDWWLSIWSAASTGGGGGTSPLDGPLIARLAGWSPSQFLAVFAGIVGANSVATLVRSASFARACLNAARATHDRLLHAVAYAPQAFHDVTPPGRLLNRFSADLYAIDETLPFQLNILLAQSVGMAGTLLVLTYATTGLVLLALPPLVVAYRRLQATYRASSREIKRLDSVSRSPLYAHFCDCLAGAAVIRAHTVHRRRPPSSQGDDAHHRAPPRALEAEAAASRSLMDDNQRTSFTSSMASQWLSLRLQGIGLALLALVAFAAVLLRVYTDDGSAARPAADALGCLEAADPPPPAAAAVDVAAVLTRGSSSAAAWLLAATALTGAWLASLASSSRLTSSSASSAGAAGLALSYSIPIVGALNGLLNIFAETEKELISVERCNEYASVPREEAEAEAGEGGEAAALDGGGSKAADGSVGGGLSAPLLSDADAAAPVAVPLVLLSADLSDWRPSRGEIEFDGLTVRYPGTLRPALNRLTLRIAPGDKVGLRGRTGSGKSTVLSALWRLVPWQAGAIRIDGVDLRRVPLLALRRALAIIPQEPLLLSGTVRYNLDPTGGAGVTDARMVWALEQCRLPARLLDAPVTEGGANFSAGERQLLCLARALLADSRVVAVDEATASTDAATDALVNEVLHRVFARATLIIIAHRATGLAGCNRIATLDQGELVSVVPGGGAAGEH